MKRSNLLVGITLGAALALGVGGCEKKPAGQTATPTRSDTAIPASYFVQSAPADARGVVEIRKGSKPGDEVVMRGRIAGRQDPFTSGRAAFMMTDLTLPICEDGCKTPWDHCCEDPKDVMAHAASVQLVGDDGLVLKVSARGQHGLAPNTEVIVVGKVASMDDAGNLVIDARKVWVKGA